MRSRGTVGGGYGCPTHRLLAILASLLSALVAAQPAASAVPDLRSSSPRLAQVIVRSSGAGAEALVQRLGGRIVRPLPIIGGFAALIAPDRLAALERSPLVRSVSADARVSLASEDDASAAGAANPLAEIAEQIGVDVLRAHGLTGAGVDVALIDSGVVPVAGMGTVLHGPDISFESQNPELAHLDTFGHGTHLAGIIAGSDVGGSGFSGIAPGARIISVKVADAFGATDVSQVIAAIDWVVQHRQTDGMNIRVLNLAFGTDSAQAYRVDPLAYAVEVAWSKGIVVVVSAGNSGANGVTDPAYDPFVIAVGAADTTGAAADGSGAIVPSWSSRGDGVRNPDLVAPGVSIVSLRAPGSFIDEEFPQARVSWPPPSSEPSADSGSPASADASEPPAEAAPVIAPEQGEGAQSPADSGSEPSHDPAADPPAETQGDPPSEPPLDPPTDPPVDPPADPPGESPADPPGDSTEPPAESDPAAEPATDEPPADESAASPDSTDIVEARFFRGSGTSQAAAIVSGVVALMIEDRRWLTPNKVKAILASVARPITGDHPSEGAGLVNAAAARGQLVEHPFQGWRRSSGSGSLELVRGSAHVVDPDGVGLAGEQDIFGRPWDGHAWALASAEDRAWSAGSWNGSPWAGTGFEGAFWAVAAWNAPAWSARSWTELSWSGRRWSGEEWTGDSWWSNGWSGRRWTSVAWMATWSAE